MASKDIENAKRSLDILKMSRGYRIEHLLTEGVVGLVKLLEWEEGEEAGKELMREIVKEFMWLLGGGEVRSVGRVGSGVLVNNLVEGVVGCGMVEEGERLWRGLEGEWFKCLGGEVKGGMLEMFYKERKWELVEELVRREKEECGGLGEEMRQKMVALLCESGDYEVFFCFVLVFLLSDFLFSNLPPNTKTKYNSPPKKRLLNNSSPNPNNTLSPSPSSTPSSPPLPPPPTPIIFPPSPSSTPFANKILPSQWLFLLRQLDISLVN